MMTRKLSLFPSYAQLLLCNDNNLKVQGVLQQHVTGYYFVIDLIFLVSTSS